jgi:FkbM family methyltransferase
MISKLDWYRAGVQNLGLLSLIRMQLQKRFITDEHFYHLTSKRLNYPVLARTASSDLAVFDQIFVEREYRCLDYVRKAGLVIDLGANVGYSSAYFLSRFPECTVLAVEPDANNFALLQRNLAPYGDRWHALQAAVWWRSEMLQFKQPATQGQEWARAVEPGVANEPVIRAVTIPELLASVPFDRISILKVDIEGAELGIFGHDTSWLGLVDNIVIELHDETCRKTFLQATSCWAGSFGTCGELTYCAIKEVPSH